MVRVIFGCLVFVIGLFSCENKMQIEFENAIPVDDLKVLNELVLFYKNILELNYIGDSISDIEFLKSIAIGNADNLKMDRVKACELVSRFELSTLEYKSEKLFYDTVYSSKEYKLFGSTFRSQDSVVIKVDLEKDTIGGDVEMVVGRRNSVKNQIEYSMNEGYFECVSNSSFIEALQIVSYREDIDNYVLNKEFVFKEHYIRVAEQMYQNVEIDFQDYFVIRIIIFEILIDFLKNEINCNRIDNEKDVF